MAFFTSQWALHGIYFDKIVAWEGSTSVEEFRKDVPEEWKERTVYYNEWIATSPANSVEEGRPFLPTIIRETTLKSDYVLFKLDIDSKAVETAIIEHLLDPGNDDLEYIDELVWEHHVDNYLMNPNWADTIDESKSIADSYQYFIRLRQRGVRAHSWV